MTPADDLELILFGEAPTKPKTAAAPAVAQPQDELSAILFPSENLVNAQPTYENARPSSPGFMGGIKDEVLNVKDDLDAGTRELGNAAVSAAMLYGQMDPVEAADFITSNRQAADMARSSRSESLQRDMETIQSSDGFLDAAKNVITNPRAAAHLSIENLPYSAPGMMAAAGGAATGAAAGAATGPAAPVMAPIGAVTGAVAGGFAGQVPVEVGAWVDQALQERGVDISTREGRIAAYSDRAMMDEIRGEAERKGITTAAVDSLWNIFAGSKLFKSAGTSFPSRVVAGAKDTGLQMVGESASEGAGQLAAYKGDTSKINTTDIALEGLLSAPQAIAETGVGLMVRNQIQGSAQPPANGQTSQDNAEAVQTADAIPPVATAPEVKVPTRDDLAAAMQNPEAPLQTSSPQSNAAQTPSPIITPDAATPIVAPTPQGFAYGQTVEQVNRFGEVVEGTVQGVQNTADGISITIKDRDGNVGTIFDSEGPIEIRAKSAPTGPTRSDLEAALNGEKPISPTAPVQMEMAAGPPPQTAAQTPPMQEQPLSLPELQKRLETVKAGAKFKGWDKNSLAMRDNLQGQIDLLQSAQLPVTEVVQPVAKPPTFKEQLPTMTEDQLVEIYRGKNRQKRELAAAEIKARFPENNFTGAIDVQDAAGQVNTAPTDGQKEAGNYKKGHVKINGMDIAIENPQGSMRSGKDKDGNAWEVAMPAHYGYVKRTVGADNENMDVYIGSNIDAPEVYVVDQVHADTQDFDEHKAMIGFNSIQEAVDAYSGAFSDGRGGERHGGVTVMTVQEFKDWLKGDQTKKPLVYKKPEAPKKDIPSEAEPQKAALTGETEPQNAVQTQDDKPSVDQEASLQNPYFSNFKDAQERAFMLATKNQDEIAASINMALSIVDDAAQLDVEIDPALKRQADVLAKRYFAWLDKDAFAFKTATSENAGKAFIDSAKKLKALADKMDKKIDDRAREESQIEPENNSDLSSYQQDEDKVIPDEVAEKPQETEVASRETPENVDNSAPTVADQPQPVAETSQYKPESSQETENNPQENTLSKTKQMVKDYVEAKNANGLRGILSNLDNKQSRAYFAELTGIKLPKTVKATNEAIDTFAGITTDQRAKMDADKADAADTKKQERDELWWGNILSKMPTDGGSNVKAWIDGLIAEGYNRVVSQKNGATTNYVLVNETGRGYKISGLKGGRSEIWKYAKAVTERMAKGQEAPFIPNMPAEKASSFEPEAANSSPVSEEVKSTDNPDSPDNSAPERRSFDLIPDDAENRSPQIQKLVDGRNALRKFANELSDEDYAYLAKTLKSEYGANFPQDAATSNEPEKSLKIWQETLDAHKKPAAPKKPAAEKPKTQEEPAADKVADFGEKIQGAKKDLWTGYKDTLKEELPEDLAQITLAKHFPEPNYENLIENGVEIPALAAIKAMRDLIPAKPRVSYKLKDWAAAVKSTRLMANSLLTGTLKFSDLTQKFGESRSRILRDMPDKIQLYVDLGYPAFTKAKEYSIHPSDGAYENGVKIDRRQWFVTKGNRYGDRYETYEDALKALRDKLSADEGPKAKLVKFDIYRVTSTGDIVVGKKIAAGKYVDLQKGFKTGREAREYLSENYDDLVKRLEDKKNLPPERRSINDPRVGEDYRQGEDVTPEMFAKEFGFRGVQFGNYVEQKRRVKDLNNAFDALRDMATVLGIPPRAVSLEGTLGLAFGARGSGGVNPAAAHYERGHVVINLTKMNGAGSLGHEWWHAMDHNFGKRREGPDYLTAAPRQKEKNKDGTIAEPTIRPEVVEAFAGVMKAIKGSTMVKRAKEADKTRGKDYWSTDIEMSARSFEKYLIDKAKERGYSNDYLSNIVPEKAFTDKEGNVSDDFQYPTTKDMETIGPAFDKLFATIENKETDKGVALYSAAPLKSALVKTVDSLKQAKGSGEQMLAIIRNTQGVKEEEIAWTGLDDFLAEKKTVTKQEIADYLAANQVNIRETTLSSSALPDGWYTEENDEGWVVLDEFHDTRGEGLTEQEAIENSGTFSNESAEGSGGTKFSQYTLPGGTNYRELLIQMPVDNEKTYTARITPGIGPHDVLDDILGDISSEGMEDLDYGRDSDRPEIHITNFTQTQFDKIKEIIAQYPDARMYDTHTIGDKETFSSSHFDQSNILTHVRLNDRTDADGKKVLFVEEIQSDWHQAGRKKGYKTKKEIPDGYTLIDVNAEDRADGFPVPEDASEKWRFKGPDVSSRIYNSREEAVSAIWKEAEMGDEIGVPDAPFKKSWHEMAFRRVVQMAADQGYDRVAWTTGEQQNERYDLSKHVDKIEVDKVGGEYRVLAFDKGGTRVINETAKDADALSDIIGKDATEKAIEKLENQNLAILQGVDLKVGGTGMKGFYDDILVKYANKFGKKFGAKVSDTSFNENVGTGKMVYSGPEATLEQVTEVFDISKGHNNVFKSPITGEKMEYSLTRVAVENPMRNITQAMENGKSFKEAFSQYGSDEIARIFGGTAEWGKRNETFEIHSLDITPEMRQAAKEGLPLFRMGGEKIEVDPKAKARIEGEINKQLKQLGYPQAAVRLVNDTGEVDGLMAGAQGAYYKGLIFLSMQAENVVNTLTHEVVHDLRAAGAFTKGEWNLLAEKAKKWRTEFDIDSRYKSQKLTEEQLTEEAIADGIANHNDAGGPIGRIIKRIERFMRGIRQALTGKPLEFKTAEDIIEAVRSGEMTKRAKDKYAKDNGPIYDAALNKPDKVLYSLPLNKKQALKEADDMLMSVRGYNQGFRASLGKVSSYFLHPHQIASLYKSFTPVYTQAIKMMQFRDKLVHDLSETLDLYNKIDGVSKKNIDAVIEIGRLSGKNFKPTNGEIVVKNEDIDTAHHSKMGETITLSGIEVEAYEGVRKTMDKALDTYKQVILEEFGYWKDGIKTKEDLSKALAKETDPDEASRKQQAIKMLDDIDAAKRKGYVPFKRWGQVGISVREKDGDKELKVFERVEVSKIKNFRKEKIAENKIVKEKLLELRNKYPASGYDIDVFEVKDFTDLQSKMDLNELDVLAASSDMSDKDYSSLRSMLSDALKRRGFRQHFFKASDVPGYSADFERALNDYVVSISGHLSRRMFNDKLDQAIKDIETAGEPTLFDYAQKYVKYINEPTEEFGAVRQMAFIWYLAGNIASGVTNAMQPAMVTAPWFKAMFSHADIAKQMSRAYKDAAVMITPKAGIDVFNLDKAPDDIRDALKLADETGLFIPLATNDAMAISRTNKAYLRGLDRKIRNAQDVLAVTFSVPERVNRLVTFTSAYRFAIKPENKKKIMAFINRDQLGRQQLEGLEGKNFAAAFAEYTVYSTQLRMGKMNRPILSRGFGTLPFQFLSFSMQALELMYRLKQIHGAKSGQALGFMLFAVVAMAGYQGFPFEKDIQKLFEAAYKRLTGVDMDVDSEMRKLLSEHIGSTATNAIMKGIPYALLNVDMSGRLGFGNIVPDDQADLYGVWYNMLFENPAKAADSLSRGNVVQAIADISPTFLKNVLTAQEWQTDGVRSGTTGKVIIEKDSLEKEDIWLKRFGFTSASVARERERIYADQRASHAVDNLRNNYYSELTRAYAMRRKMSIEGDTEASALYQQKIKDIMDEIREYNQGAPLFKQVLISEKTLKQRLKQEIKGSEAFKPRKQARQNSKELDKAYGK